MTNETLLQTLRDKSKTEQRLSIEVIDLIRQLDQRKLYLKLGYSSLFDFVTKDLGYEPSSAMRRIQAARLVQEIPEIKEKIINKELSLSVVSQAQTFFRKEQHSSGCRMNVQQKKQILHRLENKSAREAARELVSITPERVNTSEKIREITDSLSEVKIVFDKELLEKLDELKSYYSHQNPDLSYKGLIEKLVIKEHKKVFREFSTDSNAVQQPTSEVFSSAKKASMNSRKSIPATTKRLVWRRDQGRCQYRHPQSQKQCASKYFLEMDHIHRVRDGGDNDPANLRLLCRTHNQWRG